MHDIYLHIQKTGGTTLKSVIRNKYNSKYIKNEIYEPEKIESYFNRVIEGGDSRGAIVGHMSYGAHRSVEGKSRYFTLLRDPVSRVISYYYFLLETECAGRRYIQEHGLDVAEYVRDGMTWQGVPHTNNLQTRLLSGMGNTVPMGECTEAMLERAKQNVEQKFAIVGFTEAFDTSLLLIAKKLGWSTPVYWYQNKTSDRPRKSDLPATTVELIQEYNELDLKLYSFCKERFESEVAETDLSTERRLLNVGNAVYEPAMKAYIQLRTAYNWMTGREQW